MKFYGTTEYKDQYTNKGVNAEFYKSPRTSSGFSLYTEDSHPVEKKLTPKKLKEQEMTEHRSSYIWPSNSLYHQNHVRPTKRHNMAECLAAGDLITPSISASQKSHNGIEEMKTTEVLSKPMEGTKKSFVETDSIGSQILTPSSSGRLNDSIPREKVDRWGPSHNIEVTSPIQKLGTS